MHQDAAGLCLGQRPVPSSIREIWNSSISTKGTLRIHCALREQVRCAPSQGLRWAGAAVKALERLDINDEEMVLKKLAVDFEPLAKLNAFYLLQFGCVAQWLVLWRMLYRDVEDGSSSVHMHILASEVDVAWCVVLRRRELIVSWWAFFRCCSVSLLLGFHFGFFKCEYYLKMLLVCVGLTSSVFGCG